MAKEFKFTYSSPTKDERAEIESIRNSYLEKPEREQKFIELKKLDSKVKNTPVCVSLVFGIVGVLIFGLGLTMVLEWNILVWGIVVMAISLVPIFLAYPVFITISNKLKAKYSQKILNLSEELLNEQKTEDNNK